ncbi:MAG TPA: TetR/AcrR family transcriptional regulator [Acidobacteriaceae bacterium]|nr:TetR/AcrR family transcriptional regulator [Acidobacteriaceae bacterium]
MLKKLVPAKKKPAKPDCKRPYSLGARQQLSDESKQRSLDAARDLLADSKADTFGMQEVALRAGITRQTLYNLYGSKTKLIEAIFDDLARRGGMQRMAAAMQQRDPHARLAAMVDTLLEFWNRDRDITRRIRAMAASDPDLRAALRARDERRRMACRHVVDGFKLPGLSATQLALQTDALFSLTSFEFVDMLAGESRSTVEVAGTVMRLAEVIVVPARPQNK